LETLSNTRAVDTFDALKMQLFSRSLEEFWNNTRAVDTFDALKIGQFAQKLTRAREAKSGRVSIRIFRLTFQPLRFSVDKLVPMSGDAKPKVLFHFVES
jgi:hypothetical protein